jgi:hypothetical protein
MWVVLSSAGLVPLTAVVLSPKFHVTWIIEVMFSVVVPFNMVVWSV